jgi:putative oxidoreductase
MDFARTLIDLHRQVFSRLERAGDGWLIGLAARLTFLAVLFFYYLNSAGTKVGEGLAGFFMIRDGAYFQILTEQGLMAYDFDTANVPFHLDLVVWLGTYMEFLLPVLVVVGLFTRIAAIGMIVFVLVQSFVDINFHGVGADTAGMLFDRDSASLIYDQRTLWVFLLAMLAIKGAGALSLDRMLAPLLRSRLGSADKKAPLPA